MKILREGAMVMVCESHHEYGREWRNKTGHVLSMTRKMVCIHMPDCNIHVPREKVVVV
jgi:hypothetical protein